MKASKNDSIETKITNFLQITGTHHIHLHNEHLQKFC